MTEEEWANQIQDLCNQYPIKVREGVADSALSDAERTVGKLPENLRSFYKVTNGLQYEWFNLLPIEEAETIKETWDGLKRANTPQTTKFLGGSRELLHHFLVIAEIGGRYCACINRQDGSVWFEDTAGIHETDMTLYDLLETNLREVDEL